MSPAEPLWDALDVAAFLKVSRSWVYGRANAGELPCLRVGALLRFDPSAVRAYAAKCSTSSRPASLIPLERVL